MKLSTPCAMSSMTTRPGRDPRPDRSGSAIASRIRHLSTYDPAPGFCWCSSTEPRTAKVCDAETVIQPPAERTTNGTIKYRSPDRSTPQTQSSLRFRFRLCGDSAAHTIASSQEQDQPQHYVILYDVRSIRHAMLHAHGTVLCVRRPARRRARPYVNKDTARTKRISMLYL